MSGAGVHELASDSDMVCGAVTSNHAIGGDIDGSRIDNAVNRTIHLDQARGIESANGDHACTNVNIAFDVFTHEIPQKVDFAPIV
jgi:hypothetical protein